MSINYIILLLNYNKSTFTMLKINSIDASVLNVFIP